MKKILIVFSFLLIAGFELRADYNGVHVEFELEMNSGEKIHGFNFIAPYFAYDTLGLHLERNPELVLKNNYSNDVGEYAFFKERISYVYFDNKKSYQLLHKMKIEFEAVKSLEIIELINYTYAMNMYGASSMKDTIWMKEKPQVTFSYGVSYLCFEDAFIYSTDVKLKEVIIEINSAIDSTELQIELLDENLELDRNEIEDEINRKYDDLTLFISKKLKELSNLNSIYIEVCTC